MRILEALATNECSVGELVELLGEPQPKVSNHLACLRWCRLVEGRREHRTVYYRVADKRVVEMIELARGLLLDNAEHVAACRTIAAGAADGRAPAEQRLDDAGRPRRARPRGPRRRLLRRPATASGAGGWRRARARSAPAAPILVSFDTGRTVSDRALRCDRLGGPAGEARIT